jgi:hypothetical protein
MIYNVYDCVECTISSYNHWCICWCNLIKHKCFILFLCRLLLQLCGRLIDPNQSEAFNHWVKSDVSVLTFNARLTLETLQIRSVMVILRIIERGVLLPMLKRFLCLMWMMMMTLSHQKRSAISQWIPQIRRRFVYNIAEIYCFQYFNHASNHNTYRMCWNI